MNKVSEVKPLTSSLIQLSPFSFLKSSGVHWCLPNSATGCVEWCRVSACCTAFIILSVNGGTVTLIRYNSY